MITRAEAIARLTRRHHERTSTFATWRIALHVYVRSNLAYVQRYNLLKGYAS